MLRSIGAVLAGAVAALAAIMAIEMLGHLAYPLPSDLDLHDPERAGAYLRSVPLGAKLVVVAGWILGGLVGGLVAKTIARRLWPLWTVAGLLALAGIVNVLMIPHPLWMQVAAVVAPFVGAALAHHIRIGRG
jgi:hypothetical protein